jgi:hypothetical protein
MAHQRKILRDAVVTALAGLPSTGDKVFATRTYPVDATELPVLCVYTLGEDSEIHSAGASRSLLRNLQLEVEAIAAVNGSLDDTLDQLALEVEQALAVDPTFGGQCYDCSLAATKIAIRGEGEKETGAAVMTFALRYRTRASDPSVNSL